MIFMAGGFFIGTIVFWFLFDFVVFGIIGELDESWGFLGCSRLCLGFTD